LAQAGEFGFVLLSLSAQHQLVSPTLFNPILASMVLSMLVTPLLILKADALVARFVGSDWLMQSVAMTAIARQSMGKSGHVLICGYGRCGQNLARLLDKAHMPYMALDLDPERVQQAQKAGDSVVYGDAARRQALVAAGVTRAKAVAITYVDPGSAMKVLAQIKALAPDVPVVVRTLDDTQLDTLQAAGATEVVPEAIEASLMLASHALALVGVPMRKVLRLIQEQREARYSLLRGYFHGDDDNTVDDLDNVRLGSFTLHANSHAVGRTMASLHLERLGVRVVSLRCAGGKAADCSPDTVLHEGDTLVLSGTSVELANAEDILTRG
jgi:CPA2 family monovalent cation:H+ antiporter-2